MTKVRFPVEATHIVMFARAIGETNPVYFEAEAAERSEAGGLIAPPTFTEAAAQFDPDYRLRPKPGVKWFGSGATPSGIESGPPSATSLHAEQEYTYVRPIRPGEVLTRQTKDGAVWEKASRRGGKLVFRERIHEFRDEGGALVVTARAVLVTPVSSSES
ncbi:FAS1-like dehydratase domain-containing protein [Peristeroidobacter soli]|uniref:FAS1-like dehydratase domain-containing protein n=1 Tax=Peristeroidobacter soli TaxID=2497877 RepID=UPI00101CF8FB|nr:MaoC family dehydratase N-terminal domain-containing protein [Peristeroidobacter soli]